MCGEYLSQMATSYGRIFHYTRPTNKPLARGYLEQGVAKAQESLKFRPNSAIAQNNMAHKLLTLYDAEPRPETLDLAVKHVEFALSAAEDRRISRSSLLATAGKVFKVKYEAAQRDGYRAEADECLAKAADLFGQTAKSPGNLALNRIRAARWATEMLSLQSRWEAAHELLHMKPGDQRRIATSLSWLEAEACSAAIACGRVTEAITEDLERGRGILVASTHKALHDVDELREKDPHLFERYFRTRDQLLGILGGKRTADTPEPDSGRRGRSESGSKAVVALNESQ
jgi:hypothetical protein